MLLDRQDAAAWLNALRAATLAECDAAKQAADEAWRKPLADRLTAGKTLGPLKILKQERGRFLFSLPADDASESFLREGDFVRLSHNHPTEPVARLILCGEDHEGLHATAWKQGETLGDHDDWTLDADFIDLSDRLFDALDALGMSTRLLDLMMGKTDSELDLELEEACREDMEGSEFNPSQIDAVAACVAAKDAFLIQGPPGTGKTRVLAETAARLIARGETLLVTGPTHRAIDHALTAIRHTLDDSIRVVKIGFQSTGALGNFERFDHYADTGLASSADPHVIGATPFALWGKTTGLYTVRFDTVLLDEASQSIPLHAAMAMLRAERWLFFGDDKQLPPVRLGDGSSAMPLKMRSIFSLLRDRDMDLMLEESYRLSEELASWPSATFYGNRLTGKHTRCLHLGAEDIPEALSPSPALALKLIPSNNTKVINNAEAEEARELVIALVNGGVRPQDIGIVTPFRAQAARIRSLLRTSFAADFAWKEITVDTVERFQGQEREVMIVALTASDPSFITRLADFIFQPERLNVAITRARLKTVMLVPEAMASQALHLAESHEGAGKFASLLRELTR